jgi:hypothetical protein
VPPQLQSAAAYNQTIRFLSSVDAPSVAMRVGTLGECEITRKQAAAVAQRCASQASKSVAMMRSS